MSKRFRCLGDRILVKPESAPVKLGGLAVPKSQEEEPTEGFVVAAGPGAIHSSMQNPNGIRVGETVCWRQYSGRERMLNGEKFRLIRLDELDGVIEDEDEVKA